MKILWFTNILLPDALNALGQKPIEKGGWMSSLADALTKNEDVDLAVVSTSDINEFQKIVLNRITHYIIPSKYQANMQAYPTKDFVRFCNQAAGDFHPDIVHVHGTEYCYGLLFADGYIKIPALICIQGLIYVYINYVFGKISCWDIFRTYSLKDWVRKKGLFHLWLRWRKYVPYETKILQNNKYFTSNTSWARAHLKEMNPLAEYFHCDRTIRPYFFKVKWDISKIKRHTIFVPTGFYPLKGLHFVLRAASMLIKQFPDLQIQIADSPLNMHPGRGFLSKIKSAGYGIYLNNLARDLRLTDHIVSLGKLSSKEMAEELLKANVITIPSLIENGCNALQEAMLVGTPCVISYAGGMGSMANDGETALFFPPGDEAVMAECIRRIFLDDGLARDLSESAKIVALRRNSKDTIVNKILEIYRDILKHG